MFAHLIQGLRGAGLPTSITEWLALMAGMTGSQALAGGGLPALAGG